MNSYKMIACDLDGTLLATDLTLSKENREAIKELSKQGVLIVPTTGRTICEMEEVYNLPEIRYVIYSNGSVIADKQTGEKIFLGMDSELVRFVFDVVFKFDNLVIVHKDGKTYTEKKKILNCREYNLTVNVESLVKEFSEQVDSFGEKFYCGGIEAIVACFKDKSDMNECRRMLSSNPELYTVEGSEYSLEIFFKEAGKGNALKILAGKLGIEMENVITVGDSDNDRPMTGPAGLGLAVKNCCESLREVADEIICSNDEHVMQYIKKYYFT